MAFKAWTASFNRHLAPDAPPWVVSLGRLGYAPFGIRRAVVETQIAAAFPEWDAERVRATARAAYESLGRTTVETAILSRYGRENILEWFDEPDTWHVM